MATNGTNRSRTILWCIPRTVSTALAKCLSAIEGYEIWFEPYTYSYAGKVEVDHHLKQKIPTEYEGNEEMFRKAADMIKVVTQSNIVPERLPYASVKNMIESSTSPHVFVKDMAFAMTSEVYEFMPEGYNHTFLIRNPVRSIQSYRKVMYMQFSQLGLLTAEAANEKTYDIERDDRFLPSGFFVKELYDLWKYVRENIDSNPIVIDADDLLRKPAETLKKYCEATGLPYNESLLQWDASTDVLKTWKATADDLLMNMVNFYGTATKSSRFFPPSKMIPRDQLTPDVIRCSDQVTKYFEEMYETRIKV